VIKIFFLAKVKFNQKIKSKYRYLNSGIDPLPHVREMLNELSNAEAFLYARQCRVVVAKLRLCWSDINEEIKSLLKHKEYTEATIDHIRKDLIINKESVNIRKKPKREAVFYFFFIIFIKKQFLFLTIGT
jgi:hypothetical protein